MVFNSIVRIIYRFERNLIVANATKIDSDIDRDEVKKDKNSKSIKSKNWLMAKSKKLIRPNHDFSSKSKNAEISNRSVSLIFKAWLALSKLIQVFIKTSILCHLDLECHNRIETDKSAYAIDKVFSKVTLDNLSQ